MRSALVVSVVVHTAIIAVAVTHTTAPRRAAVRGERVDMVRLAPASSGPDHASTPEVLKPPRLGFRILIAPAVISAVLPAVDLAQLATNADDFTGRGVSVGFAAAWADDTSSSSGELGTEPLDDERVD